MHPRWKHGAWLTAQCVLVFTLCGCSNDSIQEHLDLARQSVQTALDTWKHGDPLATFKSSPTPIEFFDDDWQRSARLIEYEVVKTYMETDGTPRCAVDLTVQYDGKSSQQVQVTYQVVNTEKNIAIARNPF